MKKMRGSDRRTTQMKLRLKEHVAMNIVFVVMLVVSGLFVRSVAQNAQRVDMSRASVKAPPQTQKLEKDKAVSARLRADESATFALALEQREYVHLTVDQHGFDVAVVVTDPQGKDILTVDSVNRMRGPERVEFVA